MKKTIAGMALLTANTAFANHQYDGISESDFSTLYTFLSPAAVSYLTSAPQKSVLEMAQEDAVKFVAAQGQGPVSAALRTAIDEVNTKLTKAGQTTLNDNDAANMVVFINAINAKKQ